MFKALRKYSSAVILVLMSMVMMGFVIEEINDTQQFAKHTAMVINLSAIADDFDFDDDDDDEFNDKQCIEEDFIVNDWTDVTNNNKLTESKRPLSLQCGQVRRYSPRSSLSDNYNYTLLSTNRSGVDLKSMPLFYSIQINTLTTWS